MGRRPGSRRRKRGHRGGGAGRPRDGQGQDAQRVGEAPAGVRATHDRTVTVVGAGPPCAICRHRGRGPSGLRFLTHGVHLWLCASHGSAAFMLRDGGGEFVQRLVGIWTSEGALGHRRRAALTAHIERLRLASDGRDKPGSHTWPKLRREAEQRFAAGEPPAIVIDELRGSYRDAAAIIPSVRTMRRWFAQGRWLIPLWLTPQSRPQRLPPHPSRPKESPAAIADDETSGEHTPQRE